MVSVCETQQTRSLLFQRLAFAHHSKFVSRSLEMTVLAADRSYSRQRHLPYQSLGVSRTCSSFSVCARNLAVYSCGRHSLKCHFALAVWRGHRSATFWVLPSVLDVCLMLCCVSSRFCDADANHVHGEDVMGQQEAVQDILSIHAGRAAGAQFGGGKGNVQGRLWQYENGGLGFCWILADDWCVLDCSMELCATGNGS